MNTEIMKVYYDEVIVPYLNSKNLQKCLLICDGYKSHNHEEVVNYMTKVELLVLPSSTTSLTQPLDVNYFKSLKDRMRKQWELKYLERENDRDEVNLEDLNDDNH